MNAIKHLFLKWTDFTCACFVWYLNIIDIWYNKYKIWQYVNGATVVARAARTLKYTVCWLVYVLLCLFLSPSACPTINPSSFFHVSICLSICNSPSNIIYTLSVTRYILIYSIHLLYSLIIYWITFIDYLIFFLIWPFIIYSFNRQWLYSLSINRLINQWINWIIN